MISDCSGKSNNVLEMDNDELLDIEILLAQSHLQDFSEFINPNLVFKEFHQIYYEVLDRFAKGEIKNLMITMPPQHGKSEGSTRNLPAYMLGRKPDLKIAIGSYSGTFAQDFNNEIQRIIDNERYELLFPDVSLSRTTKSKHRNWKKNSTVFEIVNHGGSLRAVGVGGGLTGRKVDVMIMDDLYKNQEEGNSPLTRAKVERWYTSVVRKRLHNDSQQLIVFTRWHEEDLIGYLEEHEEVFEVTCFADLEKISEDAWVKINFEAIKETEKNEFDNRELGEALWEERHSANKLNKERKLDPLSFDCMNQGKPNSKEGLLYGEFETYTELPSVVVKKGNYTDTADTGDDYLCSICYDKGRDSKCYVTDILFTQEPMEKTEITTPLMLKQNQTRISYIESNNGGRGFARVVQSKSKLCKVVWFHQGNNKESRIITNGSTVTRFIVFPVNWKERWPEFASHITRYKRIFNANKYHDGADVLTGIIEKEVLTESKSGIKRKN